MQNAIIKSVTLLFASPKRVEQICSTKTKQNRIECELTQRIFKQELVNKIKKRIKKKREKYVLICALAFIVQSECKFMFAFSSLIYPNH